ncbi:unnamed protein product [Spirodela intermedia]|uniref:poly(ADP-ribose) glycohydrolase n=1 Tax=Spirodela intermedia TaxID=51605 RepID=A0A7I8JDA6_SPIIN|nr:unnamed protein product [Spirodela intermedia]CAA6668144.1 unnamed protein product [Spirodela intermedia]
MESRQDLASILPLMPLTLRSSSLFWPPKAVDALKALSLGPDVSRVDSGKILFDAIIELRDSVRLSGEPLAFTAADGYTVFFDELISREHSRMWFGEVVPGLARLLLRLPSLLEAHYRYSDRSFGSGIAGLRILYPQEAGIVFLSQELIAALLACSFFCLFPPRSAGDLQIINFDCLFAGLYPNDKMSQKEKIKFLIHYFERVCSSIPTGFVSFERKVLSLEHSPQVISYPDVDFWGKSGMHLCSFKVSLSGFIEDQHYEALEVDFANERLGGGALSRGCLQEEIRFMINPELIAGMLFLPSMKKNEAIEIIGAERFSNYTGYASTLCFAGDHKDLRPLDYLRRRKRKIVAIDALCNPRMREFKIECIVRETNKAFCGFLNQSDYKLDLKQFEDCEFYESQLGHRISASNGQALDDDHAMVENPIPSAHSEGEMNSDCSVADSNDKIGQLPGSSAPDETPGVATGNWGCGAFGETYSLRAQRPFILYYTFGEEPLQRLEQVTQWILLHGWTVGDLWNMLVEYSSQRFAGETSCCFFSWLLPEQNLRGFH